MPRLVADEALWPGYLERLALELPGWSGMFLWRARHPGRGDGTPVAMGDYLAVRVLLERLLCEDLARRLGSGGLALADLDDWVAVHRAEFYVRDALCSAGLGEDLQGLAQLLELDADLERLPLADAEALLACAASLDPAARGQVWLLAYERHYREQIFAALTARRRHAEPRPELTAQVVLCMDDREEGTRRHHEEEAPAVATYGAAGFFGVAMAWQGIEDATRSALCQVVVEPLPPGTGRRSNAMPGAVAGASAGLSASTRERGAAPWPARCSPPWRRGSPTSCA